MLTLDNLHELAEKVGVTHWDFSPVIFSKPAPIRRGGWRLRVKFYWYKYVRRIEIVGFFGGIPIIRTKYLEEESGDNRG